jgi:hypothetical protein
MPQAWPNGRNRRPGSVPPARTPRLRLLPTPANDNGAPVLVQVLRTLALLAGFAAIGWVAASLILGP